MPNSTLISGAASNGTYQATCTLPNGLANANYTTSIQVDDSLGNIVDSAGPMLTLTGSTEVPGPVVTPSTSSMTVTAGIAFNVTWTVVVVASITYNHLNVYEPNGNELPSECSDSTLISGAASNGTYQATCTLPNGLANANYTTSIQVDDSLGNIVDSAGPMLTLTGSTEVPGPVVTPSTSSMTVTAGIAFNVTWTVVVVRRSPTTTSTSMSRTATNSRRNAQIRR